MTGVQTCALPILVRELDPGKDGTEQKKGDGDLEHDPGKKGGLLPTVHGVYILTAQS